MQKTDDDQEYCHDGWVFKVGEEERKRDDDSFWAILEKDDNENANNTNFVIEEHVV